MRLKHIALLSLMAATLAGCNETLDSAAVDLSSVKDKVQHPLPDRILTQMKAKGMDRNSPIMIRIFKEEGVLEIWKAKSDNRFEKIVQYDICAWSGRLRPAGQLPACWWRCRHARPSPQPGSRPSP